MKSNWLLAPLSALYGLAISIRHMLYDEHILPSHCVSIPTICVGNLTIGGTGKTPHTEYLIRLLSSQYKVAVLSRGYKRKTRGFHIADKESTAATIGDEPMQIHRKFPQITVAVCENRVRGIKQLQCMVPDLQVIILDDALQHRSVRCGFNILLTAADNLYVHDHLLPWGYLRDLKRRSLAADAVIVTKCPEDIKPIDKRIIDNTLSLPAYQKLYFSHIVYDPLPIKSTPLVISGIAQPSAFFNHILSHYPQAECIAFRDHHRFTESDEKRIAKAAQRHEYVITTEKDYERLLLTNLPTILGNKLQVLPISVKLDKEMDSLKRQLFSYINETIRHKKNIKR